MNGFSRIALIGLVMSLCAAPIQANQKSTTLLAEAKSTIVKMEFDDVPLHQVVKWLSEKTKKNFIVEQTARNIRITIFSGTPVTVDEAYQAFLKAIEAEGLQVTEEGKFVRITRTDHDRSDRAFQRTHLQDCPISKGISKINDTTFQVKPESLAALLEDNSCWMSQARIVPSFKDGAVDGIKLFGIRPSSIFAKLGFLNGDVIQKINGTLIASPDKALELYSQLKTAKSIEVDFSRQGEAKKYTYRIE